MPEQRLTAQVILCAAAQWLVVAAMIVGIALLVSNGCEQRNQGSGMGSRQLVEVCGDEVEWSAAWELCMWEYYGPLAIDFGVDVPDALDFE